MRSVVLRGFAVAVALLIGGIVFIEVRHHSMYGHWFRYGWHVDVLSDRLDNPTSGIALVQYAAVINFTFLPGSVDGCIPNDPRGLQIPVSASHIETQERSGWKTVQDVWPFRCDGRIARRTLWPLMAFYTEPQFPAYVGRKGDWVRLVASSSFDASHSREFASMPFQLTEGAPKHCPNECVTIRSLAFCEPLPAEETRNGQSSCKKLGEWRDRPGSSHPPTIDLVVEIQNTGSEMTGSDDFVALTTTDSLIAPTRSYGLSDLDKMKTTVGWSRERDVRMAVIEGLHGGETRFVRIPGFSIQKLLEAFVDDPSSLWPWWIRVNVRIEGRDGERVAAADIALPLVPSDKRLAGKIQEPPEDHHIIRRTVIAPRPRSLW